MKSRLALLILLVSGCKESPEAKARHEWEAAHCKLVRTDRTPSTTAPVVGSNGKVSIVFIPGHTTHSYSCDDGTGFSR